MHGSTFDVRHLDLFIKSGVGNFPKQSMSVKKVSGLGMGSAVNSF